MTWALVVAARGGQRSRAAREVADALLASGLRVGGFVQRTDEVGAGAKVLTVVRLRDGLERPLARPAAQVSADGAACSLAFDPAGFAEARAWVDEDVGAAQVLVLDGLGKLELSGEGHRAALDRALGSGAPVVLAVRDDQLVYAVEALGLGDPLASYTDGEGAAAREAFVAAVVTAARGRPGAPPTLA
jgi:nucleoside-triphosphatase THEP1